MYHLTTFNAIYTFSSSTSLMSLLIVIALFSSVFFKAKAGLICVYKMNYTILIIQFEYFMTNEICLSDDKEMW